MKIAIIRLSALGDIIQSTIILQVIKEHFKGAKIHYFIDERFKDLLFNHPLIDELFTLPLKDKKILKSLKIALKARKNKYDLVIDMQGLIKSALLSKILSNKNYGFDKDSIRESFASAFYTHKVNISYNENIYIRNLSLLCFALNLNFDKKSFLLDKKPSFFSDERLEKSLIKELNLSEKFFLIHCGSSVENKIYPKEKMAKLCKNLASTYKYYELLLCFGSEKEKNYAQFVLETCKKENVKICKKLSLQELICLTNLSSFVLGNDSGPTHLAFALNKPSLSIFGATPSKRNAYETSINFTIDTGKEIDAKKLDKNDFCIRDIDENEIFKKIRNFLDEKK